MLVVATCQSTFTNAAEAQARRSQWPAVLHFDLDCLDVYNLGPLFVYLFLQTIDFDHTLSPPLTLPKSPPNLGPVFVP